MQREKEFLESLGEEEAATLRECLYILQGIDGERIQFHWETKHRNQEGICIRHDKSPLFSSSEPHVVIPPHLLVHSKLGGGGSRGAADALAMCAEAGWLYTRIQIYIHHHNSVMMLRPHNNNDASNNNNIGSVSRALASALDTEMESYQQLLAEMEESGKHCCNLRSLLIVLQAPLQRLKTLAMLTDGVTGIPSGGPLLRALHLHTRHGDSRHCQVVSTLLSAACRPWLDMLFHWTTRGMLLDPAGEFFVTRQKIVPENSINDGYYDLWSEGYRIDETKIPIGIIDEDLVAPAFKLGLGINFIRQCLQDGEWSLGELESRARACFHYTPGVYGAPGKQAFRAVLTEAVALTNSHLLQALREDHSLMQHLYALKQFLLLGQGDFFSAIMDGIHLELEEESKKGGRVVEIYRHTLAGIVELAIRSTNASNFPSHIIERIQVQLRLDPGDDTRFLFGSSDTNGRDAWDVLLLEYVVPDPLRSIVHRDAMVSYQQIFVFLFGLKKVEFLLNSTWRQSAVLQHALQGFAQHNAINVMTSRSYAQAIVLLRKIAMTRQSMMHFVVNFKSYLMFEVLEGGWKDLVRNIGEAESLDEVILAHGTYLENITRKTLLINPQQASTSSTTRSSSLPSLGDHVKDLLNLCGEFCDYQQHLFGEALKETEVAAQTRREAEQRVEEGAWGFDSEEEVSEDVSFFGLADGSKLEELGTMATVFAKKIRVLLKALDHKLHGGPSPELLETAEEDPSLAEVVTEDFEYVVGDEDDGDSLRFLTFQLDQNKFYELGHLT